MTLALACLALSSASYAALPSITSLAPTSGAVGASVTITGSNFGATQGTSTVKFNGTTATPTSWSASRIVAPVPVGASSGTVTVTVSNKASNGITFTVTPTITSLSPNSAAVGISVTVSGNNFGASQGTSSIKFNGATATPTSWSANQIVVPVPSGATSGNVVVTVGGFASNGAPFTILTGGYLAGRLEMTPSSYPQPQFQPVNLSDPEILDWAYWGLSSSTSVDRKSGTNVIGNLSTIGPDQPTRDSLCFDEFMWTNGNVNPSVPIACAGLILRGVSDGFQLTVPADTTPKTLKLYVGIEGATAKLTASMSDNSAVPYIDTNLISDQDAAGLYSIDFRANSPGQTLTVSYTFANLLSGAMVLEAAVLTPKHPDVTITQPTAGQSFSAPASFTANVQASQLNSTVTGVSLLKDGVSLITLPNSPFDFQVSDLSPGNYDFTALATDASGLQSTSQPVPIHVVGNGGELVASVATPPSSVDLTALGTADWVLLGRVNGVDVDRKANVAPLISAMSRINWAYWYGYPDNAITYSAEDGTQQFSPASSGVYSPNPGSGFEFTVDAGIGERTVNIYLGAYRAQGKLEAYLSDGSAPVYMDTSTDSGSQNVANHVYSLRYRAASEGQKLTVRYTLLNNHNYGNVTLQAVTVNGQPRPFPAIASTSHSSDAAGTLIWIDGSNFGVTAGSVLFNGVAAQIVSWSDNQIEVLVPAGATSGPLVVNTDGASSNGVNFTIPNPSAPGPAAKLLPSSASMLVGDSRSFHAVDSTGIAANVSSWSSSDTTVADFSPDPDNPNGPPLLTATAAGHVTITADTATADVTVYEGATLSPGTVIWSVPMTSGGNGFAFSVQATPAPGSLADLFVVQSSGSVQALKADGTFVWNASLGFDSLSSALPDPSGGLIGLGASQSAMARIDAQGTPSWSIRPQGYTYESRNMAVHPDGTIFLIADMNARDANGSSTYVIGIDGLHGTEKFRVPLQGTTYSGDCSASDFPYDPPRYSPLTIAPDGQAYLLYAVQANSNCTAQGQTSDVQTGVSLRVLKVGSDGSNVDAQIQQWSEALHKDVEGSSDPVNQTETDVTQDTYTPAPLPEIHVNEMIPDNRGNLLAAWDYSIDTYDQTCTDTYSLVPNRHLVSFSCSGEVPGQPDHAHISLLNGTSLQSDFTLDGVDYFDGPMVMGEGDTVFGIGGRISDDMDRVLALNATNGATLWTSPGTFDSLQLVAATADGGVTITATPESVGNASVIRYDTNGNSTSDPPINSPDLQYLASDAWIGTLSDGSQSQMENAALDWALSPWDSPRGPQRPEAAADPKVSVNLTVSSLYVNDPGDITSDSTVRTLVNSATALWWEKAKISLNWDGNIRHIESCLRTDDCVNPYQQYDMADLTNSTTATEIVRNFCDPAVHFNCTNTGSQLLFLRTVSLCGGLSCTAQGWTYLVNGTSVYGNFSAMGSSAQDNDTAHELGHQFQLQHQTFVSNDNLMCSNVFCPTHAGDYLNPSQTANARKGAKELEVTH